MSHKLRDNVALETKRIAFPGIYKGHLQINVKNNWGKNFCSSVW